MCSVLLSFDFIFMQVCCTKTTSRNCGDKGFKSNMETDIFRNEGIHKKIELCWYHVESERSCLRLLVYHPRVGRNRDSNVFYFRLRICNKVTLTCGVLFFIYRFWKRFHPAHGFKHLCANDSQSYFSSRSFSWSLHSYVHLSTWYLHLDV